MLRSISRRLLPVCSWRPSPAAAPPALPARSGSGGIRVVAAENFWGSIASPAGRRPRRRSRASSSTRRRTPTHTSRRRRTPARWPPRSSRSSTASATTRGRRSCWRANPAPGTAGAHRRQPVRPQGGRQPAPLVRPGRRDRRRAGDHRRPEAARPQGRRATSPASCNVRDDRASPQYHALIAQIRSRVRRRPGRRVGEHLRAPGPGAWPQPGHALQLHEGDQRGHRGQRAGHDRRPSARSRVTRSRCGSTTRRTRRRRSSG